MFAIVIETDRERGHLLELESRAVLAVVELAPKWEKKERIRGGDMHGRAAVGKRGSRKSEARRREEEKEACRGADDHEPCVCMREWKMIVR